MQQVKLEHEIISNMVVDVFTKSLYYDFLIINVCDHLVGQEPNKNMPNWNVNLSFH